MTIEFPDLSHYRPGIDVKPLEGLITKATQGTGNTDPSYAGYRDDAIAAGIPFEGYHWLNPDDWAAQAKHAFAVAGPKIPLMIDDEDTRKTAAGRWISPVDTAAFISAYRGLGGIVTLWYYPKWIWEQRGRPSMAPVMDLGLKLVSSSYPKGGYTENGPGWEPYGGYTPTIWQYTSSATLQGHHDVDMNAFKGTQEQLRAVFMGEDPEDMPVTPADAQIVWDCDTIPNPSFRADSPAHVPPPAAKDRNENTQADFAIGDMWQRIGDMQASLERIAMPSAADIAAEIIKQLKG